MPTAEWRSGQQSQIIAVLDSFVQVYDLEKRGGSIVAGVLKMMQDKKANPPPARDARLPPKPAGQTVGSFRRGLVMLPEAIAANLSAHIRCAGAQRARPLCCPKCQTTAGAWQCPRLLHLLGQCLEQPQVCSFQASALAAQRGSWILNLMCGAQDAVAVAGD